MRRSVNRPESRYYWDAAYLAAGALTGAGAYDPDVAHTVSPPLLLEDSDETQASSRDLEAGYAWRWPEGW